MNYGRKKVSERQKSITAKKTMRKKRVGVYLFKGLLIFMLVGIIVGGISVARILKKVIDDAPKITKDMVRPSAYTTTVYADNGKTVLATFVNAGSNREYASIDEIPLEMQNAIIAVEDSRFREHNGVDVKGIARALFTGIADGELSQGASTITQQLIKNSIFPNFNQETRAESFKRKIQEQYLALELEKIMSKDEILENYLNTINFGQNTLGVQAAANRYFGKPVKKLTLSECATIAAITQNPTKYNPINNPDDNAVRREKVLRDMLEQEMITQQEFDEAMKDDVYERIQDVNEEYIDNISPTSYFVDEVAKQVISDLQTELGFTESQAYNAVYSGGLSIITTQNKKMQKICEQEINRASNYPSTVEWGISCAITIIHPDGTQNHYDHNGLKNYIYETYNDAYGLTQSSKERCNELIEEYIDSLTEKGDEVMKRVTLSPQPQASIVVMDQSTGYVKAMVGGRGEKTESMSLNRATQSYRQPGSCFKVLSTYVPALDINGDTLATVIDDVPTEYKNGTKVNNWWKGYKGSLNIRECIERSANVCTVRKYQELTPELGYQYLTENFGLTTLAEADKYAEAACLGGITNGVYNIEMTAAYAAIANGGTYIEPILYTHIYDHEGNLLYENVPKKHVAMKKTTAALLTDAMQDVITGANGTGGRAKLSNMPVAGKTGTTTKAVDLWLSAYTPYLTCSVWAGYDDNKSMENMSQSFHMVIWKNVMERIHEKYDRKEFTLPKSIEKRTVCKDTGLLVSSKEFCTAYTEYFAEETAPTQSCPGHPDREEEAKKKEEEKKKEEQGGETPGEGNGEVETPPEGTENPTTPETETDTSM